jgi:hypothetical protein
MYVCNEMKGTCKSKRDSNSLFNYIKSKERERDGRKNRKEKSESELPTCIKSLVISTGNG